MVKSREEGKRERERRKKGEKREEKEERERKRKRKREGERKVEKREESRRRSIVRSRKGDFLLFFESDLRSAVENEPSSNSFFVRASSKRPRVFRY